MKHLIITLMALIFFSSFPLYVLGQSDSIHEPADSSYILTNKKIYRIIHGKKRFKAYLQIYKYAIDSAEVPQYLNLLFAHKNDTLIIKHSKQYEYSWRGLSSQDIIYKAVFKRGPKVKFFVPEVVDEFSLHWWYVWGLFLSTFILVFALLVLIVKFRDKLMDENIFMVFFIVSFGMSFLMVALSQILMVDFWAVPEKIAYVLVPYPPIYAILSVFILWILYKIFLKKTLIKLFERRD